MNLERRDFIKASLMAAAGLEFCPWPALVFGRSDASGTPVTDLPAGAAPEPVSFAHFPDPLHAFVWRNWTLVPIERIGRVIGASRAEVLALGRSMGLSEAEPVSPNQWRRSYITIIRRNWHLLPYSQLLQLLDWTPEHMAYILQEDDFLFIKLGSLKPKCPPLRYSEPGAAARARANEIAAELKSEFPSGLPKAEDPLFGFVAELSRPLLTKFTGESVSKRKSEAPRFCYSYFALYGDPLLEPEADPYPEGYLQRLAAIGVNGVWLQAILAKLAPLPWIEENEADQRDRTARLVNLRRLAERAERHGIAIYLYLNEPRSMPLAFFNDPKHAGIKGVTEGDRAALCTSAEPVRNALSDAVAHICNAVPGLGGFFTITASENFTNCWSHGAGARCPRCGKRSPAEVIAELNSAFLSGIQKAGKAAGNTRLIAWDWGWSDGWADDAIKRLPKDASLMSVSEWGIPIQRGGVISAVGEYSISTIGPGTRAKGHWKLAHERGLKAVAKIQAGNTWELSAVPYIPALESVARHAANLKEAAVDGLMLGWTLGGYPSPNLEIACEINKDDSRSGTIEDIVSAALERVAKKRFGAAVAPAVLDAWRACSKAFGEFPFNGGLVYNAPMQFGPSNLLWAEPTHYKATMIGFPYDDLDGWRQIYPPAVFIQQFRIMARGFREAFENLKVATFDKSTAGQERELRQELNVMEACAIHFESTANQAAFVEARNTLAGEKDSKKRADLAEQLKAILTSEIELARRLHAVQQSDSRIGFEASNQYYYVPQDLLEKVINCNYLLRAFETRANADSN